MWTILKQTVSYQESEDRLLMLSQCSDGTVQAFWLTKRLSDRLIRALFQCMEMTGMAIEDEAVDEIASWSQYGKGEGDSTVPVSQAGDCPQQYLVQSIDISPLADGQQLLFHAPGCNGARFALQGAALRQWLRFLRRLYSHASWGTVDVWPAWFDSVPAAQEPRAPRGTIYH